MNIDADIRKVLEAVTDPEIPVISIEELGILREIVQEKNSITVFISPTYSGCPAMDIIAFDIKKAMAEKGYQNVEVKYQLSPAWTTDDISEIGREKLKNYGIAPPEKLMQNEKGLFQNEKNPSCPRCNSENTKLISLFGSTPCKSLHQCLDCQEPFDKFKCH